MMIFGKQSFQPKKSVIRKPHQTSRKLTVVGRHPASGCLSAWAHPKDALGAWKEASDGRMSRWKLGNG